MSDEALDDYDVEDIDIDEAIELVQEAASDSGATMANAEDWISTTDSAVIYREPVVIDGDLTFPEETFNGVAVIFEKGLTVSGTIEDCGGEDSAVIVLGDLEAGNIVCQVYWLVSGDVKIEGTAFGFGTGDYMMEFDGDATCALEVTSGYTFDLGADETVDAELDPTILHESCLEDDEIVVAKVANRLRAGQSILA
jgi:hypothetical protein